MLIKMDEQTRSNLLVFLNRVEVKGLDEVNEMMKIVQALHQPIPEPETKQEG